MSPDLPLAVLVLWIFWLFCSAFQFLVHLRKNVRLALGCCCCSATQSCPTICDLMNCSTSVFLVHHHLLEFAQTHVHRVDDAIQPSHPLSSLLLLPSIFPSMRVFSSDSALCIRWPKYRSFSFSISPSKEYSGLISFRMDWLDLLAVQGTLKSLLHTTVRKHRFFGTQPSLWTNSHICTW